MELVICFHYISIMIINKMNKIRNLNTPFPEISNFLKEILDNFVNDAEADDHSLYHSFRFVSIVNTTSHQIHKELEIENTKYKI